MEKALLLVDLIKGFGQEGYDKNMYCQSVEKIKKNIQELVEEEENGVFIPKIKISSSDKTTLPFNKQIYLF